MPTFAFAFDGRVDMMSINPLEMTKFEATGAVVGIIGVILTLLWNHYAANRRRQRPHEFLPQETDVGAID